jgi:putative acetyltransferase
VSISIREEDPRTPDVAALIRTHLEFAHAETPSCHVFALSIDQLDDDDITLYAAREGGRLLGIAALRRIDDGHREVKSMHTARGARRQGVAATLLHHLVATARSEGADRLSLETGTSPGFAPARALYESSGFEVCAPFGDYEESPDNVCMTVAL